jgi:hypothetical protein
MNNVLPIAISYPNWEHIAKVYPNYLSVIDRSVYTTSNPASFILAIGGSADVIDRYHSLCTATFLFRDLHFMEELMDVKAWVVSSPEGLLLCTSILDYGILIFNLMTKQNTYQKRQIGYAIYKMLSMSFHQLCNTKKLILLPDTSYYFGAKNESDHQDKLLLASR